MEKWDRILKTDHVVLGLRADRKWDVIRELAAILEDDKSAEDFDQRLRDLIRRERERSTGIGKGVAIPRAHEDSIYREVLASGISRDGIEFDAIEGELVHIVALLGQHRRNIRSAAWSSWEPCRGSCKPITYALQPLSRHRMQRLSQ